MGKHKNKHNKQPLNHGQQHTSSVPSANAKENTKKENEAQHKENQSMGLKEIAKNSSITDWLLTLFTAVLATASIYQFTIMNGQLDDMRKDQRPWVELSFKTGPLQVNAPVSFTISIVNKGKTPAKAIKATVAIDEIQNGQQPTLAYPRPHPAFTTGLLFPNDPWEFQVVKPRTASDGRSTENYLLSQTEFDEFQTGKIFFVMYATISYNDFFGIGHWTKRCAAWVQTNTPGTFAGQKCTDYSDVDDN